MWVQHIQGFVAARSAFQVILTLDAMFGGSLRLLFKLQFSKLSMCSISRGIVSGARFETLVLRLQGFLGAYQYRNTQSLRELVWDFRHPKLMQEIDCNSLLALVCLSAPFVATFDISHTWGRDFFCDGRV